MDGGSKHTPKMRHTYILKVKLSANRLSESELVRLTNTSSWKHSRFIYMYSFVPRDTAFITAILSSALPTISANEITVIESINANYMIK